MDATVVTRILENGGRIIGKAACENFSHGASSSSSPFGPVENPYAIGFSCGGSSSGCGGLIGSGAADMGIGGDQGGSIRIVSIETTLLTIACQFVRSRRAQTYFWTCPIYRYPFFGSRFGSCWAYGSYGPRYCSSTRSYRRV